MQRILLISLLCILQNLHAQTSLDTLVISDKLLDHGIYFPSRPCFFVHNLDKVGEKDNIESTIAHIDSIKIGAQIINKYNQKYYLILQDSKGRKVLEGHFFDEFPNGHVITYYSNGNKKYEGDYEMRNYKKDKIICKGGGIKLSKSRFSVQIGEWKYYSTTGELIETKTLKN